MSERQINLLSAFTSWDRCSNMCVQLMEALKDAGLDVTVLALEGLSRIENDVKSDQFPGSVGNKVRDVLRQWRCESPLTGAYSGAYKRVPKFLRSLTIFTTFKVPLFIDDFGKKELLNNYTDSEDIHINEETAIFHVTHSQEAGKIVKEQQLKPSDNKNIIEGTWFGLDESPSVYGSESFQTTFRDLGVKGLQVFEKVIEALKDADPAIAVLALEGLFCIEEKVNSKQFPGVPESQVKNILRKWRCESPLSWGYETDRAPKFLKGLTIFKTLQVPLFIDNYGNKELLSSFKPEEKMDVRIDGDTPIFHVTHQEEAERIASEGKFQPSDNKNIIKGIWFG
ncbi:unnamed protein product, partial [Porites evermanni]